MHNKGLRSSMRTKIKDVLKACDAGDKEAAVAAYKAAVPVIDSMVNKGIVNKNKAARHKSRLNKRVKELAAGLRPRPSNTSSPRICRGLFCGRSGALQAGPRAAP